MTILGYNIKPKLWSVIVTMIFVVLFVQLGNWQLSRADEKKMRQEQLDQLSKEPIVTLPDTLVKLKDFQYRMVEVRGEYVPKHTILLDNKTFKGVAGYHVLTPIRLVDSSIHVLINRGWIATGPDRSQLPELPVMEGEVTVTGIVVSPIQRMLKLSESVGRDVVWGNFDLERYEEITGLVLQPVLVLQKNESEDGLVRQWEKPGSGSDRNLGYAVQWFSLAGTIIVIFLVLNVKRSRSENKQA